MTLFSPLITIFVTILLGIFCYKKDLFTKLQIDGFEQILFRIIIPCYLFTATYKNELSELLNTKYITAYLLTFGVMAIIVTTLFIKKMPAINVAIRVLSASYLNTAIYTLPVITILLKDPTAAIIGNIIQVIIIQPIFIILLNTLKHQDQSLIRKIFGIITTPLIIMPIIGILLNYLQIELPLTIVEAISQMGIGASGLALFVFGLTLGATKINLQCLRFDLLTVVFIKNLIHPCVAICIAYLMKLENYWFNSLVIAASAPTAFLVYLISKKFSTEEELVKKVVALSSVVATFSLVLITLTIN
jgi:predicted permease